MNIVKIVFLTAAVLWTMPVRVTLRVTLGRESAYAITLLFYALPLRFQGPLQWNRRPPGDRRSLPLSAVPPLVRRLLRGAGSFGAGVEARLGADDAALTALLSGLLESGLHAALAAFCLPASVRVIPDFNTAGFVLTAHCIVSLRGGDIIRTAMAALPDLRRKKVKGAGTNGQASH